MVLVVYYAAIYLVAGSVSPQDFQFAVTIRSDQALPDITRGDHQKVLYHFYIQYTAFSNLAVFRYRAICSDNLLTRNPGGIEPVFRSHFLGIKNGVKDLLFFSDIDRIIKAFEGSTVVKCAAQAITCTNDCLDAINYHFHYLTRCGDIVFFETYLASFFIGCIRSVCVIGQDQLVYHIVGRVEFAVRHSLKIHK